MQPKVTGRPDTSSDETELKEPAVSVTTHRPLPEDADGYLIVVGDTELKKPAGSGTTHRPPPEDANGVCANLTVVEPVLYYEIQ